MITFQDAIEKIKATALTLPQKQVALNDSLFSVVAEDICFDMPMPPFDKSAMDGYACARNDIMKSLSVIDTIYAGKQEIPELKPGECVKIMTGAPVPKGADIVFMKEDSEVIDDNTVRCLNHHSKNNICYQGEDISKGDLLIKKGTLLEAKHVPILAGGGYHQISVYSQPEIGIFTTGSELVEPNQIPGINQIRNSNASQIIAQLKSLSLKSRYFGIIKDDIDTLKRELNDKLEGLEVLIMSGGVSVGEFDLVPDLLKELGFNIEISNTAIQPGKPMVFARKDNKYVFGLSGNPVASFIQFELYVKPFLFKLQGYDYNPLRFKLPLKNDFLRKKGDRLLLVPACITNENTVEPIPFHGSAHISALLNADCLIEIPIDTTEIKKDQLVSIRLL